MFVSTIHKPSSLALTMQFYTCIECNKTYRYDRSWHKTPPEFCGRCLRLSEDVV